MKTNRPGAIPLLERLPAEQKEALFRWLTVDHFTYAKAQARLAAEFRVKTSPASLSAFWHSYCLPRKSVQQHGQQVAAVRGKVLAEIQVRPLPGHGFTVAVIGGDVPAHIEQSKEGDTTTLRLVATPPPLVAVPTPPVPTPGGHFRKLDGFCYTQ